MTSETRTGGKSAFEIYAAFAAQGSQVGAIESFFQEIEGKLVVAMMGDGQTATVHCDAVADLDSLCDKRCANLELRAPISCMNPEDTADFLDQAGKHELIVHRLTQIHADFFSAMSASRRARSKKPAPRTAKRFVHSRPNPQPWRTDRRWELVRIGCQST